MVFLGKLNVYYLDALYFAISLPGQGFLIKKYLEQISSFPSSLEHQASISSPGVALLPDQACGYNVL